jgi:hypothetical protein
LEQHMARALDIVPIVPGHNAAQAGHLPLLTFDRVRAKALKRLYPILYEPRGCKHLIHVALPKAHTIVWPLEVFAVGVVFGSLAN